MEYDIHSSVKGINAIAPAVNVADVTGAAIDVLGFESIEYILHVGAAMVGGGFDATIEQSPDDGSGSPTGVWTAVPAAETLGALPVIAIGDANKVLRVGSIGKERHQRIVLTETGVITAGVTGVAAVLGNPVTKPVPDQST